MNWYLDVLKNYADFDGRAGREEFWYFILFNILINLFLLATHNWLWAIYTLSVLIPCIAVSVRRLHDTSHSGWWVLIAVVPVLGFVFLFLMLQDSDPGVNQYGFNPKDVIA
jgi:uncharacterized membrane protein YhaH (DUF805 family)